MKLCIFTPAYPGKHDTSHYAFVKQLVDAIAASGVKCYVVVPYNILHYRKVSERFESYNIGRGYVSVYRPYYYSLSDIKVLRWVARITRKRAIKKAISKLPKDIDVVYAHFWASGYDAYNYAKINRLPLFVATGESNILSMFKIPSDVDGFREYIRGVICVSSKNRDESIRLGLTTAEKCGVFPNAVNKGLFYKRDKKECRVQLGLPQDDFIVVFVGWFIDRKGPLRVAEAIGRTGNIKSIFIGKGEQEPQCEGILFKGSLPHDEVPLYLSAADCFVLPTLAEGCCNAVVEAMACGLPVISSNLPFNWDVLDETNSIMVDPHSVKEIADALSILYNDEKKRELLALGALNSASNLTIEKRAASIMKFISDKM